MSDALHSIGPTVPRETQERLDRLRGLIQRWNRSINLVSRHDLNHLDERHFDDCRQLAPLVPRGPDTRGIDIGSGAGFPGLVLAIVTGLTFDLVEADQRKAAFLREAARLTQAPVAVHAARVEAVRLPPAPLVTARALAPLDTLLRWAAPLLSAGGIALFPKGDRWADELTRARQHWRMGVQAIPSLYGNGTILRITELSPVIATH